jgi:WD40 repeat protein
MVLQTIVQTAQVRALLCTSIMSQKRSDRALTKAPSQRPTVTVSRLFVNGDFAISPDGKRLLEGQHGESVGCRTGSPAFSPDGKPLAGAAMDKIVKVWDAQTGQELLTIKGRTKPLNVGRPLQRGSGEQQLTIG